MRERNATGESSEVVKTSTPMQPTATHPTAFGDASQLETRLPPVFAWSSRHVTVTVKQRTFLRESVSVCTPITPDRVRLLTGTATRLVPAESRGPSPSTKCQGSRCAGVLSLINTVLLGLRTKRRDFERGPSSSAEQKKERTGKLHCGAVR